MAIFGNNIQYYASCSGCGHILAKSSVGTESEVKCPKCGSMVRYEIDDNIVSITMVERSTKHRSLKKAIRHEKP